VKESNDVRAVDRERAGYVNEEDVIDDEKQGILGLSLLKET
jgi:hypothetical protein